MKYWSTPYVSEVTNGESLEVYIRKCLIRVYQGKQPFAPALKIQVYSCLVDMDLDTVFDNVDLNLELEQNVELIMGTLYKGRKTNGTIQAK